MEEIIDLSMNITKDTKVCISMAERPGNFGATLFNAAFAEAGLDYIYKPFKITPEKLKEAIAGIRAYGIIGCGVSMPHKMKAMEHLNTIDESAQAIGAINTIVNNDGQLTGYNTDFIGAKKAISEVYDVSGKNIVIVGAGGVSRAIIMALKANNAGSIKLVNRDEKRGQDLAKELDLYYYSYYDKASFEGADMLINATPVGMLPEADAMIVDEDTVDKFEAVMDVVVYPFETLLLQTAKKLNKTVVSGFKMSLYQAEAQFKLYTGQEPPSGVMEANIKKIFIS
jgi:shikimate dehydrogenase